jgi:hypothetical protein
MGLSSHRSCVLRHVAKIGFAGTFSYFENSVEVTEDLPPNIK